MKILRSLKNVSGDLTVTGDVILLVGDIVVSDKDSGVVLKNQSSDKKRLTVVTDEGVDTIQIKDA